MDKIADLTRMIWCTFKCLIKRWQNPALYFHEHELFWRPEEGGSGQTNMLWPLCVAAATDRPRIDCFHWHFIFCSVNIVRDKCDACIPGGVSITLVPHYLQRWNNINYRLAAWPLHKPRPNPWLVIFVACCTADSQTDKDHFEARSNSTERLCITNRKSHKLRIWLRLTYIHVHHGPRDHKKFPRKHVTT